MYRIGWLHGCCQHADMFRSLMKPYEKKLGGDRTHDRYFEGAFDHSRAGKTWFAVELDLERIGEDIHEGAIEETLDALEQVIRAEGINMLVGFSQGGNVVDSYLRTRNGDGHIHCVWLFNTYTFPRYVGLATHVDRVVIVSSEEDEIVPTKLLDTSAYPNAKIHMHSKGHKICTTASFIRSILQDTVL